MYSVADIEYVGLHLEDRCGTGALYFDECTGEPHIEYRRFLECGGEATRLLPGALKLYWCFEIVL